MSPLGAPVMGAIPVYYPVCTKEVRECCIAVAGSIPAPQVTFKENSNV